jgi:hypothetical protein
MKTLEEIANQLVWVKGDCVEFRASGGILGGYTFPCNDSIAARNMAEAMRSMIRYAIRIDNSADEPIIIKE